MASSALHPPVFLSFASSCIHKFHNLCQKMHILYFLLEKHHVAATAAGDQCSGVISLERGKLPALASTRIVAKL